MTRVVITPTRRSHRETETCPSNPNSVRSFVHSLPREKLDSPFADRMHPNANLLPLQRAASNEDYHYGQFDKSPTSHITVPPPPPLCFQTTTQPPQHAVDLHRLLEPHLVTTCKVRSRRAPPRQDHSGRISGGGSHLMSPLQSTSGGYNPMAGANAASYGHPYSSAHHSLPPPPPPQMHGLPPSHFQAQQQQQQQQQNPHMISVQNGPVILVSNLNEDVS